MSQVPPPPAGFSAGQGAYRPQAPIQPQRQAIAPTLGQYWRSDSRVVPGRKPPTWAGRAALWLGLLSAVLFFTDMLAAGGLGVLGDVATPLSVVAFFFALIALIAGIGRGAGFFGAVFAVAGNIWFWQWLDATFG